VHKRTPGDINLTVRDSLKRPGRFTTAPEHKIKQGKRQHPFRVLLRLDTDKTNVVLRVPKKQFIHPRCTFRKRPYKGILPQKAFSRCDTGNGPGGTDKQAVTAFNTATLINRNALVRKSKNLRRTSVRTGAAGSAAKTATDARMRHVHRRGKR
jgi:hypothetical protein